MTQRYDPPSHCTCERDAARDRANLETVGDECAFCGGSIEQRLAYDQRRQLESDFFTRVAAVARAAAI